MLKYQTIIDHLTVEQKLSLAASVQAFSSAWAKEAGIPSVRVAEMQKTNADHGSPYPSFAALANCWDPALWEEAAKGYASLARKDLADLLYTPRLGVQCDPFCEGISEDPYLAGKIADSVCRGVRSAGVTPCLSGVSLRETDIAALDKEFDARALYEYFLAPWRVMENSKNAVSFSYTKVSGTYADANVAAIDEFLHREESIGFVLAERADLGRDAECLNAGNILADGDRDTLRSALERDIDGKKELSPDELDSSVDRAIDLMMQCRALKTEASAEAEQDLALRAAEESAVLLKNEGVLPLKKGCRVAIVGHPDGNSSGEFYESLQAYGGFECVGFAEGYQTGQSRSDEEIPYACKLAEKADAVLVFLRHASEGETAEPYARAKFPANRLALADALFKVNPNIVAVVSPEDLLELSFNERVSALLMADTKSERGVEALLNILSGKVSPSGKLASTRYNDTDARFAAFAEDKKAGRCKAGTFLGYRRYDAAGEHPDFPFGFGLGYSRFGYSDLTIQNGNATFTLRNKGKYDAAEVVQMYIGKDESAVLRPRKELKAFQKVFLRAGESVRLSFPVARDSLAVYNDGGFAVEDGMYRVCIAASSLDVRLETTVYVKGGRLVPDGRHVTEYIPSLTNIFARNYTLGPVVKPRRWKKLLNRGLILMGSGFSLALLVTLLGVCRVGSDSEVFFNTVLPFLLIFVAPPIFLAGGVVAIVALVKRKRAKGAYVPASAGCLAAQGEVASELSYEKLFEDAPQSEEKAGSSEDAKTDESAEALKFCDASVTFPAVCGQMAAFFSERGITIGTKGARKLLAAFSASRLVVLQSGKALPPKFFKILSDYFGSGIYLHECGETEEGGAVRSNAARAFQDAASRRHVVHVAAYSGAVGQIASVVAPFHFYIENPARAAKSAVGLIHSSNVWFVFALCGERGADIPENACVVDLDWEECTETEAEVPAGALNYYQFAALSKAGRNDFCLDEDKGWKKIDQLEKFVGAKFDNKTWMRLEKFSSACLACGSGEEEALDCAAAAVLMTSLKSRAPEDFVRGLEHIFGAEDVSECKKTLENLQV